MAIVVILISGVGSELVPVEAACVVTLTIGTEETTLAEVVAGVDVMDTLRTAIITDIGTVAVASATLVIEIFSVGADTADVDCELLSTLTLDITEFANAEANAAAGWIVTPLEVVINGSTILAFAIAQGTIIETEIVNVGSETLADAIA